MLDMLRAPTLLDLDDIAINGGTQPRAALNQDTIAEYAEALKEGADFPPVIVYYDGKDHWLADGFHRYHAHRRAELTEIHVDIRQGTRRDAVLYSVSANSDHGLRRTNEDKRRAVLMLLNDPEWNQWSDREIARRCKVHHQMVGNLRTSLDESSSERTYTTRHGTVATMNTANIGASTQQPPPRAVSTGRDGEGFPHATMPEIVDILNHVNHTADVLTVDTDWLVDYVESTAKRNSRIADRVMIRQSIDNWRRRTLDAQRQPATQQPPPAQPDDARRTGRLAATLAAAITSLSDDDLRNVAASINIGLAYGDIINELRRLHLITKQQLRTQ